MTSSVLDDTLTDRQLRFVFEYLLDLNASAAAVRAGYAEGSRASQAHELMNNPAVRDRIRVELRSLLAEAGCSALDLMKERMKGAFFRADKLLGKGWKMLPSEAVEPDTLGALQVSGSFGARGPVVRVKQPDRDRALRALERVHERLEDQSERYYARLEREGKLRSLEEIEAMDGEGDTVEQGAGEISVKTMVLSGCGGVDGQAGGRFSEKRRFCQVRAAWAARLRVR
jgi:phage terminase small subunit